MTTKKLNEKKVIKVSNVGGCTNFGGVAMVGKKMYTLKTRSDNALSYVSVYSNYKKTKRTSHKFANCMGHGNDMCYNGGKLYVAPCANYVEEITISNWSHRRVACDIMVSAIAHYTGNQFIISCGGGAEYTLAIGQLNGGRMDILRTWKVRNPKYSAGYSVSQGIGFYKKKSKIYTIFTKSGLKQNVILRSSIGVYEPDYCFTSKLGSGKYEFESIDFTSAGKKIIAMNKSGGDCIMIS